MTPTPFGRFLLVERLEAEPTGPVFLARPLGVASSGRLLIKQLLPAHTDPEFPARFIARARSSVQLNHSNVVSVFEVGVAEGISFLATEYLPLRLAGLLDRFRTRGSSLPQGLAVFCSVEVCRGLEHAHERGVVHGGALLENIRVSFEGEVKVDGFCFPQPLQGSRKPPATISDDLFAVGALLRELFPGQDLARELETVMFEALATNSRYRQAWAIADDLLAGEGIPTGSRQKLGEFIRGIEAPR